MPQFQIIYSCVYNGNHGCHPKYIRKIQVRLYNNIQKLTKRNWIKLQQKHGAQRSGFTECTKRIVQSLSVIIPCENTIAQRTLQKDKPQQPICYLLIHLIYRNKFISPNKNKLNIKRVLRISTYCHDRFKHVHSHGLRRGCGSLSLF